MTTKTRRLRPCHLAGLALALSAAVGTGCGADTGSDSSDVTDVQHTDVKQQTIGNCWIYASVGWAESLHKRYTSQELNLSESYLTYWHWLEQISGGAHGEPQVQMMDPGDEITTGGRWGVAGELMMRYGLMEEGTFIPEEEEAIRSDRQGFARNAINASLKDGVLSDHGARRDPAIVRAELDKAWQLTPAVVETLNTVFGPAVERTVYYEPLYDGTDILGPSDLAVGHVDGDYGRQVVSLAQAIGTSPNHDGSGYRNGEYTWSPRPYPSGLGPSTQRNFLIDVQRAMHASMPVLMSWLVDFNAMEGNSFVRPPETPGRQGGHLIVLEDYQINNVPGYGTLAAGTLVSDPVILEAALSQEAQIEFFRIKNSWGASLAPDNVEGLEGYHDLYMEYLNGPIAKCHAVGDDDCGSTTDAMPLRKAVLPSEGFMAAASGTCDAAVYQSNCSGQTLQRCLDGRLERFDCTSVEEQTCRYSDEIEGFDCLL